MIPTLSLDLSALDADPAQNLFDLLCQRRGWSPEYLKSIEKTEHAPLKDLDTMVTALHLVKQAGREITIAPDFDMDGIASGVLGYAGLKELGFDVNLHVPDYKRGHDLRPEDIDEIAENFPNTSVLLTCDGAVNSHEGIGAARAKGWLTLVTDHHQELEPGSTADVTVDPCRIDETYELRGICGAHVLYQVLYSYAQTHDPTKLWHISLLRLFAGLGTVSDVMPVLYENRQLVRDSLSIARLLYVPAPRTTEKQFGRQTVYEPTPDEIDVSKTTLLQLLAIDAHAPEFVSAFEGFALLLKAFAQAGKVRDIDSINEGFYGFYAAPAMNSPRRTGAPLEPCFTVFTAADEETKLAAMHTIIKNNDYRKEMREAYIEQLLEGEQPFAPWVYFSDAPSGMLGLLANEMMQLSGNPAVVMNPPTSDTAPVAGSARAPGWFEVITTLDNVERMFAIGHQQACGVKLESAEDLPLLVATLAKVSAQIRTDQPELLKPDSDLVLGRTSECDADLTDTVPLMELIRRIEGLRPFGHDFTEPIFEIVLDPASAEIKVMGSEQQHLRITTREGTAILWWNAADKHYDEIKDLFGTDEENPDAEPSKPLRLLAKLQLNEFREEVRLQAIVEQIVSLP